MKEPDRLARNKQRLTTLAAQMAVAVRGVLTRMENHGCRGVRRHRRAGH
jgi:hypothetical protein